MALSQDEIELIRASWIPARKDPTGAGVLLFKGLFTKFPDYLKFFNQFVDLDLEQMHENKRLIKHAVKVIDTVTFVVDSIGDESKSGQLHEALVNLIKGHLKRRIGLKEFHNLGIVLIDFICDLNNRRQLPSNRLSNNNNNNNSLINSCGQTANSMASSRRTTITTQLHQQQLQQHNSSSTSSSQDSETMTSALDKIRASSSPSSSSDDESLLTRSAMLNATPVDDEVGNLVHVNNDHIQFNQHQRHRCSSDYNANKQQLDDDDDDECDDLKEASCSRPSLDTGLLVQAWRKQYGVILDLVKSEELEASH